MDSLSIKYSKAIDSNIITFTIIECIENQIAITRNEIIISDYREYLIDITLKEYFILTLNNWDIKNIIILDILKEVIGNYVANSLKN